MRELWPIGELPTMVRHESTSDMKRKGIYSADEALFNRESDCGTETKGGGVPRQSEEVDSSHKYAALLCLVPYRLLGF